MNTSWEDQSNKLLAGLQAVNQHTQVYQPGVWGMNQQLQLTGNYLQQPTPPTRANLGQVLMQHHASPQFSVPTNLSQYQQTLHAQHYVNPQLGWSNYQQDQANWKHAMTQVMQGIPLVPPSPCTIGENWEPLLVRFNDEGTGQSVYVPVEVLPAGELHRTNRIPDMVINFHANIHNPYGKWDSKAITVRICPGRPQRERDIALAVTTLYAMHVPPHEHAMVTIPEFTKLYDLTRRAILKRQGLRR